MLNRNLVIFLRSFAKDTLFTTKTTARVRVNFCSVFLCSLVCFGMFMMCMCDFVIFCFWLFFLMMIVLLYSFVSTFVVVLKCCFLYFNFCYSVVFL